MRVLLINIILLSLFAGMLPATCQSAESGWNEAGVRMGIQATPKSKFFRQYEAFGVYGLPWDWRNSSGWGLTPQANGAVGIIDVGRETSFIGSVGTALNLNKTGSGLSTKLGINANILERRHVGGQDFGSVLQFGAYLGLAYCFNNTIKVGYRIQHISNGHIFYPEYTPNPGLDMHLFSTSVVF